MSITNKQISQDKSVTVINNLGTETIGVTIEVSNAAVVEVADLPNTGLLLMSVEIVGGPNNKTCVYALNNNSGANTLTPIAEATLTSDTKDTASHLNVYYETNTFKIQNLFAASADAKVTLKIIG